MLNLVNLLADKIFKSPTHEAVHDALLVAMIVLMLVSALTAVILILLQPSNSTGIDALGGSSETFFGKNKGKSIEAKMKKWTWICLAVLVCFAIAFYVIQLLPVFFN
ncbi:MAG: preprotein translocase subunit SecG [Clostridia bacterium]|nr:preprotein translocase subunit SecG [Clostridia bacterium]